MINLEYSSLSQYILIKGLESGNTKRLYASPVNNHQKVLQLDFLIEYIFQNQIAIIEILFN